MEYKCNICKDTHFITARINADGSEEKSFCYCHPLVKKGALKPLDGSYAFDKIRPRGGKNRC